MSVKSPGEMLGLYCSHTIFKFVNKTLFFKNAQTKNRLLINRLLLTLVRVTGLEPAQFALLGPKPSASTNSATPANSKISMQN